MEVKLEDIWQEYNFEHMQYGLENLFPEYRISLQELVNMILTGDILGAFRYLFHSTFGSVLLQLGDIKSVLLWIFLLGIASCVITHFVEIFDHHQIADLGYYFMYLMFMVVLFRCFGQTVDIAKETLENIVLFIQLMIPAYLVSVGVATGLTTAAAYSQIYTLVIYGVERILSDWVPELVTVYAVLAMVNGIWVEERLTLLVELIKKIVTIILKGSLWVVTGISVFQSLISPVLDTAKNSVLQKVVSMFPGIGNMADGVVELVIGSAVIIKNCIGVVLLLLLLSLCAAPLMKIVVIAWALRVAAAFLGMISDKRLVNCTNQMGEGCMLIFRMVGTGMLLFLILISVMTTGTNRGF